MADPNWNSGFYYDGLPPHTGMKLARRECQQPTSNIRPLAFLTRISITEIATITYRSGPEWDLRFGRQVRTSDDSGKAQKSPTLCPDFLIETYLDHQVCYSFLSTSKTHHLTTLYPYRASNFA